MRSLLALSLFFISGIAVYAGVVDTVSVHSVVMMKDIKNVVIFPDSYEKSSRDYPVLYLLHGAGGNYAQWIKSVPELKELVDQYQMIIVCPDGGVTSWYFNSPIDKTMQYETYVAYELVSYMSNSYRILKDKSKHAITGLSMGGHGAFYLAFKHQDVWGAAGSMSGGVDIRPFPNSWDINKRLGSFAENKESWEKNTVLNMVYLLDKNAPKLIFDCGTSDFFFRQNQALHTKLLERNIPHDYIERPGSHNWAYWKNSIQYQLLFFDKIFRN
ncbi:esterase family protein [Cellulophaga sp. F20128]|uniref:alpha/beta hydrolase n=1 Tax=Cellulophaga sp. F20128 TaxID=2926413 RepID=UPI001FF57D2A|nr:alpha/beta hydrolase family protein [Cellulophaga sp. F20128]MCK0158028.1 esterase family protein [Cellulophaga sp. F20128]